MNTNSNFLGQRLSLRQFGRVMKNIQARTQKKPAMLNQCPQCKTKLGDFAVACESCGWSIVPSNEAPPVADRPPVSAPPQNNASPPASTSSKPARGGPSLDTVFEAAMGMVESGDFSSALEQLNHAVDIAPIERLGECYSLRGYCQLKKNDFIRAEDDCSEAISLNCRDAQTYAWRAAARGEQNKWKEAFDDLDDACMVAGDDRDSYLELMDSYATTASEHFRKLVKAGDETADTFFERGWIYLRSGKLEKAKRDFLLVQKIEPEHAWTSVGLARLLFKDSKVQSRLRRSRLRQKRNKEAGSLDDRLAEIIRLSSIGAKKHASEQCQWEALSIRARLYRDIGELDLANRDLARLTVRAADDPEKIVACCQLRYGMEDYMDAVTDLTDLLTKQPNYQRALLLRGRCFSKVRSYPLAIEDLELYLRLNPADTLARADLAQVFLLTHQIDRASEEFEKVTRNNRTSFEAHLGLSQVFLEKDRLDLAIEECDKAIAVDSSRPEAFAIKARIYLKLCDFTRAIDSYSRAAKIASDSDDRANYLYLRGAVYYEVAKFEDALTDFRRSCRLRPNHAGAWVWKSAACSRLERWSDANESLAKAMAIRPDAAPQYQQLAQRVAKKSVKYFTRQIEKGNDGRRMYRDRAVANQFLNMHASAIEDLTTALEREPTDVDLLIRRGQVYAFTGDHGSALEDFTNAIRIDRRNHWARFCRAQSRLAAEEFERAQRDVQKAIRISGGHPQYHKLLAEIFEKENRLDQVVRCLDRATLLDSTDAASFRKRGEIQVSLRNWLPAVNDYTRSLELDPSQTDLLLLRGQAYAKAEKLKSAILDFEMTLTRNPLVPKAYSGRALALATLGERDYALIWLTKAFHRFSKPRDLCELVFARGKINYSACRYSGAITDFSSVAKLMSQDDSSVLAAKYARGIARVQMGQMELAEKDFKKVIELDSNNLPAKVAIQWLVNQDKTELPPFLVEPDAGKRPVRPPVVRSPVEMTTPEKAWQVERPFHSWVLRTLDKKEYGPIDRTTLNKWIQEGRIDFGMRLLRADWAKWKRVERIFEELLPSGARPEESSSRESFPDLDLKKPPVMPGLE